MRLGFLDPDGGARDVIVVGEVDPSTTSSVLIVSPRGARQTARCGLRASGNVD